MTETNRKQCTIRNVMPSVAEVSRVQWQLFRLTIELLPHARCLGCARHDVLYQYDALRPLSGQLAHQLYVLLAGSVFA